MSEEYPLFPRVSDAARQQAVHLVENFKVMLTKVAEETIGELYSGIIPHIESDAWGNYRNDFMDGIKNYDNRCKQSPQDFKEIRQAILKNHREDIINDLNQDMVEEIARLKEVIERLREEARRRY